MDVGAPETSGTRVVSCWTGRLYMWLEKAMLLDLEYHGQGVNKRVHLIGTMALLVTRIRAIPVIQAVVTVKGKYRYKCSVAVTTAFTKASARVSNKHTAKKA